MIVLVEYPKIQNMVEMLRNEDYFGSIKQITYVKLRNDFIRVLCYSKL